MSINLISAGVDTRRPYQILIQAQFVSRIDGDNLGVRQFWDEK